MSDSASVQRSLCSASDQARMLVPDLGEPMMKIGSSQIGDAGEEPSAVVGACRVPPEA